MKRSLPRGEGESDHIPTKSFESKMPTGGRRRSKRSGSQPASGGGCGGGDYPEQEWATLTGIDSGSGLRQPNLSSRERGRRTDVDTGPSSRAGSSTQEGKRKRRMTTPPAPDQSPLKPPLLDTGEHSETAAEMDYDSSQFSSPLRRPIAYDSNSDPEVVDSYHKAYDKYKQKIARLQELPTLKQSKYIPNITAWHDLKQKNAILDVAESVLSLSSFDGDKEINRCTGIIIEWVEANRSAIIITSSQILCTKVSHDDWKDNSVYDPNAKVIAYLLDGTPSELELLHFNNHYEIAVFKIMGNSNLKVASLDSKFEFGQEACVLGRDGYLNLICRRTIVKALDPFEHQKNHLLFIGCPITGHCTGGALANFNRDVVGMILNALPTAAFIPISIILSCLRIWKKFGQLGRPHLGLKLRNVGFLDISYLENLSRGFGIKSGLIVAKVSMESPAEKHGIRLGDVVLNCQGNIVSTITEFEDLLLAICEKEFEKGNNLNSKVVVELGVYNLRRRVRRTVTFSVKLSDCMEIVN